VIFQDFPEKNPGLSGRRGNAVIKRVV